MAKQRLGKIKAYYKAYNSGDSLYNRKLEKLVYNGSVSIVGVSKNGVKYAESKWIFDLWFREAQDKLNRWIRSYYNWTSTGKVIK